MDKVTEIRYTALPDDSPYVKTFRMYYTQNGKEKSWDLLKVHDSVAVIIFNRTRNTLVLVRQFRPGKKFTSIKFSKQLMSECHLRIFSDNFIDFYAFNFWVLVSFIVLPVAVYHAVISVDPDDKSLSHADILAKYPPKLGITNELCAGIVDKSKPLVEIAKEEVLEECGYNVPIERLELVLSYRYLHFIEVSRIA